MLNPPTPTFEFGLVASTCFLDVRELKKSKRTRNTLCFYSILSKKFAVLRHTSELSLRLAGVGGATVEGGSVHRWQPAEDTTCQMAPNVLVLMTIHQLSVMFCLEVVSVEEHLQIVDFYQLLRR